MITHSLDVFDKTHVFQQPSVPLKTYAYMQIRYLWHTKGKAAKYTQSLYYNFLYAEMYVLYVCLSIPHLQQQKWKIRWQKKI